MALNIKRERVEELARRSAELREVSITDAVQAALERDIVELEAARLRRRDDLAAYVKQVQARVAAIPTTDTRSTKEIRDWLWDDSE